MSETVPRISGWGELVNSSNSEYFRGTLSFDEPPLKSGYLVHEDPGLPSYEEHARKYASTSFLSVTTQSYIL